MAEENQSVILVFTIATILVIILTGVVGFAFYQMAIDIAQEYNNSGNPVLMGIVYGISSIAMTVGIIIRIAIITGS